MTTDTQENEPSLSDGGLPKSKNPHPDFGTTGHRAPTLSVTVGSARVAQISVAARLAP
jgi:hypothetical protein